MMLIVLLIAPLLAIEIPKCPEPELNHGTTLKVRELYKIRGTISVSVPLAEKMEEGARLFVIRGTDTLGGQLRSPVDV